MTDPDSRLDPDHPIDPVVAAIIRRKANRMVGRAGLRSQDRADLEQELVLRLLERQHRFAAARGTWPAFVRRVVENAGTNVLRFRGRYKRTAGPTEPLTEKVPAPDHAASRARAADLSAALAALPPELRAVAELMAAHTVTAAARALGVSRSTVYARLQQIRDRPEWAALGDNL